MRDEIKNNLKKKGIFKCKHPSHEQFDYAVSPYHVLKLNKCWPSGCIEFLWRCRQFEKGHKCPRKYKHVGRGCASCKYYHEDKNCYAPATSLSESELREFLRDLDEYVGWVEDLRGKSVRISGKADSVRPHLAMNLDRKGSSVRLEEFYISFTGLFIDRQYFDDNIFLKISAGFLGRFKPAPGDEVECDAIFNDDRGRIVLHSPRRVEIIKSSGFPSIDFSKALIGRATGKIIKGRADLCRNCEFCSLLDVHDSRRHKAVSYRRFYCLRGISDPESCPVRLGIFRDNQNRESISESNYSD